MLIWNRRRRQAQRRHVERAWELFSLINPVNHANNRETAEVYKVEPYVVAADVYANEQHLGRGGWTWYTGSAGWMYRLLVESLLGLQRQGDRLRLAPCVPPDWEAYRIQYRFGRTLYDIEVRQRDGGAPALSLDGVAQEDERLDLRDDGGVHAVVLEWPRGPA